MSRQNSPGLFAERIVIKKNFKAEEVKQAEAKLSFDLSASKNRSLGNLQDRFPFSEIACESDDKKCKIHTFVPNPLPVEHKSSRFTSHAML